MKENRDVVFCRFLMDAVALICMAAGPIVGQTRRGFILAF